MIGDRNNLSERGAAWPTARSSGDVNNHWAKPENFKPAWDGRAELAASLVKSDETWFCDLGCGPRQPLEQYLPIPCAYLPADLKQWTPNVAPCDLNVPKFPESCVLAADVCFMLGVCEYLYSVQNVLDGLSDLCDTLVLSYCSTDFSNDRLPLWVNAYSGIEFGLLLKAAGFQVENSLTYSPGQYVMRAKNRTEIAAERRVRARRTFRASRQRAADH